MADLVDVQDILYFPTRLAKFDCGTSARKEIQLT